MENRKITSLPALERPREKLLMNGPGALNDSELLALLLGSGTQRQPLQALCESLLELACNSLDRLAALSMDELCRRYGIGIAKASVILAAMEIGARRFARHEQVILLKNDSDTLRVIDQYFVEMAVTRFFLVLLTMNRELLATCELNLNEDDLPEVSAVVRLSLDAGAGMIALVRNRCTGNDYLVKEKDWLVGLGSVCKVLKIQWLGRLVYTK